LPLELVQQRFAQGAEIVLLCANLAQATGFRGSHDFALDAKGNLRPPDTAGQAVIYAGRALVSKAALQGFPSGPFSLFAAFERAMRNRHLAGVVLGAHWLHVGDPAAIIEVENRLAVTG
jgi:MurNAc alpha-1-phosphate uridylyltransferase